MELKGKVFETSFETNTDITGYADVRLENGDCLTDELLMHVGKEVVVRIKEKPKSIEEKRKRIEELIEELKELADDKVMFKTSTGEKYDLEFITLDKKGNIVIQPSIPY